MKLSLTDRLNIVPAAEDIPIHIRVVKYPEYLNRNMRGRTIVGSGADRGVFLLPAAQKDNHG